MTTLSLPAVACMALSFGCNNGFFAPEWSLVKRLGVKRPVLHPLGALSKKVVSQVRQNLEDLRRESAFGGAVMSRVAANIVDLRRGSGEV